MGLFSTESADVSADASLLRPALKLFNETCGTAYSINVELNAENLKVCGDKFQEIIPQGFPSEPGPFKRLGAFCILSQIWCPFNFTKNSGTPNMTTEELLLW